MTGGKKGSLSSSILLTSSSTLSVRLSFHHELPSSTLFWTDLLVPGLRSVFGLYICLPPVCLQPAQTPSPETPAPFWIWTVLADQASLLSFCLFGPLNFINKVLNCSNLRLCCSWVRSHTQYKIKSLAVYLSVNGCFFAMTPDM